MLQKNVSVCWSVLKIRLIKSGNFSDHLHIYTCLYFSMYWKREELSIKCIFSFNLTGYLCMILLLRISYLNLFSLQICYGQLHLANYYSVLSRIVFYHPLHWWVQTSWLEDANIRYSTTRGKVIWHIIMIIYIPVIFVIELPLEFYTEEDIVPNLKM